MIDRVGCVKIDVCQTGTIVTKKMGVSIFSNTLNISSFEHFHKVVTLLSITDN